MYKNYPEVVSRTIDPNGKALTTIVGLHDHQLSDADINLMQDLQDYKRQQIVNDITTSGCLTYGAFQFNPSLDNTFLIPQFDVLFNGEVVTIAGHLSDDPSLNRVTIPAPPTSGWVYGNTAEDAQLYVIFLEIWYQTLDGTTGLGYLPGLDGQSYFYYPYGCVNPDITYATQTNPIPDDSIDILDNGLFTTQRAQIQWRFNVQRVALTYDFSKYHFGLDPGARPTEVVYPQASNSTPITGAAYTYWNQGDTDPNNPHFTGDSGLWAAGDLSNGTTNSLNTLDGLSYAMPVAVVFQRNTGVFDVSLNPFGCTSKVNPNLSGRYDLRLATQIFAEDVVDTRQTVSLAGWDMDKLMKEGFVDVITGNCRSAICRGESPGLKSEAVGSALSYYVSVAPTQVTNTDTIGQWDGFANGFSSDQRTFYVTKQVVAGPTTSTQIGKSVYTGSPNQPWQLNDAFTVSLPAQSTAVISSVTVQSFNTQNNVKTPITLLPGQIQLSGIGSNSVTVTFVKSLQNTPFDPGSSNIYATIGVQYPANNKMTLKQSPYTVVGGELQDSGNVLPVFGVSEYQVQSNPTVVQNPASGMTVQRVSVVNPEYSNVLFGTKIWLRYSVAAGIAAGNVITQTVSGQTTTSFIFDRTGAGAGLYNQIKGLYVTRCWDLETGNYPTIVSRIIKGNSFIITLNGAVDPNSTLIFSFLAQGTAQLVYNAPVKGVTEIEEVVLFGTYSGDATLPMEKNRVVIESISYDSSTQLTTIVLAANNCVIKGISGDDTNKFIWVKDAAGNLTANVVSSANFNNGLVTVVVKGDYSQSQFLFVGAILPAFDSTSVLKIQEMYVPYQGEGDVTHAYEILHSDENALITTNGSGKAPVVGLADVYPYNRELPIANTLPMQADWTKYPMSNTPLATFFDSNYEAMRQNNVEHTFEAPLHTNDFIPPMNKDIRKKIKLMTPADGGAGFAQAIPHIGFAIRPPVPRTVLGQNLQSTTAPIVIYVNNLNGSDNNDGLSLQTPKLTITAALNVLPPVLRHPCSIQLVDTSSPYSISSLESTLQTIALGDGDIRSAKYYALGNLSFTIQEGGRLVVTRVAGATGRITIDATGFTGFGDGPTSAFFVDNSRVIFNGIQFKGFRDPAIKGIDSDIDFVDCDWQNNLQAGSFEQGCGVILDGGNITLPDGGTGMVLTQSELTVSGTALTVVAGADPGAFFIGERQSTINLDAHSTSTLQETNILATTVVAEAQFNSSIVVTAKFQTSGSAVLTANSTLARTVTVNPFLGGASTDESSTVITQLS